MTKGRRPLIDPTVRKRINVPRSIAEQVDIILIDPISGGTRYNAWADYVNKLIRDDLAKNENSVLLTQVL